MLNTCDKGHVITKLTTPASADERHRMERRPYHSLIGSLLYVAMVKPPDISFAQLQPRFRIVNMCARELRSENSLRSRLIFLDFKHSGRQYKWAFEGKALTCHKPVEHTWKAIHT
ncbi:hypothetical protein PsorP6_001508 [Peronosclerospora sorghi]|uniref:Uncharacterized protein n=1 Tax=Peronosclerospora sorghi TaxID=230839 RepID=A0ACC0WRR9_9STRA|nr:hypothetical protein PsorP6_001508 [Peronosclerospora sorghi]